MVGQMKYRIYPHPFTRINEFYNYNGEVDSAYHGVNYSHPAITTPARTCLSENDFQSEFYDDVAIDFVCETVFDYPYPQITEKTIRPLVNKKAFVIIGAPRTLDFLQEKGFQTFHPFINESYDKIEDPIKRLQFLQNEISRICALPIDNIKQFMLEYQDALQNNFDNFHKLRNTELECIKNKLKSLVNK